MNIDSIRREASNLRQSLQLASYPVGVKFIFDGVSSLPDKAEALIGHRYCQALMKARHGKHVTLDAEGIACPAAAAAFGFKPLPEGLKNGVGLMGFGITDLPETGVAMFEGMTKLEPGKLKKLYLFPLETAEIEPDIVVVEDETERLMWLVLAELNRKQGTRISSSTAVLQATCVDATLLPYVDKKFNISLGCYGCRDATDMGPQEAIIGFPFELFESICEQVSRLSHKAMPNSRAKQALSALSE